MKVVDNVADFLVFKKRVEELEQTVSQLQTEVESLKQGYQPKKFCECCPEPQPLQYAGYAGYNCTKSGAFYPMKLFK